jgi:hypothetical protein
MATDWAEARAAEFIVAAKDRAATALEEISSRLRDIVRGALDKSKADHLKAAIEQAKKDHAAELAAKAEVDAAVAGDDKKPDGIAKWAPKTAVVAGEKKVLPNGTVVVASKAGTTGAVIPTASITDGDMTWGVG